MTNCVISKPCLFKLLGYGITKHMAEKTFWLQSCTQVLTIAVSRMSSLEVPGKKPQEILEYEAPSRSEW